MAVKVKLEAQMPAEQVEGFLQLIRAWDGARDEVRVTMAIDARDSPLEDPEAVLRRLAPAIPNFAKMDRHCPSCGADVIIDHS